ncbi:polyphenol oxidase E, chloroplastic-like [Nicotiana tabacum]|uniref:catechol oxidase n=1 Tax=Nicotiana tabacum TaxID=4097 RepID=A0A1S4BS42_TOBAC
MASSVISPVCNSTPLKTPFTSTTKSSSLASTPKPSQLFLRGKRNHSFKVSCKVSNGDENKTVEANSVDRRNVLLGLGGLYGASNVVPLASATPIPAPTTSCSKTGATIKPGVPVPYSCCPPPLKIDPKDIPYYKFPTGSKLRIRPASHAVDEEYMAKYNLAITKMKELDVTDPDDPRGFTAQAKIHCAYCNGAYTVAGKELQIHFSWLFFPFHRWYLYFYERILGSLINDPTFGLPYWNWDHPKGMRLPHMFDQPNVYPDLYDPRRNQEHRGSVIMDLGHFGQDVKGTDLQMMSNNLTLMYRQMITNSPCPQLFFGKPYCTEVGPKPGQGAIENIPHTPVHIWVGSKPNENNCKNGEDMGNFYSAGKDPAFYSHHANVDRMWTIWKTLGGKRKDINKPDYLNTEFFFYDEKKNPYLVKVRDCLDNKKMGYDFQAMPTPWRNFKPLKKSKSKVNARSVQSATQTFPIAKIDKPITFSIKRETSGRTQQEKDAKEEMLTFLELNIDQRKHIRFDVFINADANSNWHELDRAEFAGSYTALPHVHSDPTKPHVAPVAKFQLAITELLEEIGLEDEDDIVVTLVPKTGGEFVAIKSVVITLEAC